MSTVSTEAPLSDGTLAPAVPALPMSGTLGSEVALNDPSSFSGSRASPRPATMVLQRAARYEANNRPGSAPGTSRQGVLAVPRSQHENAMLTSIRRHMEALEEKLGGQISRVQLQSDRLRDAAFARVDQKMGSMESLQPKFDRRLAELSGNYKGLSDEMQAQIKRVDQLDSKIWDFRHQLEEELRHKMSELEAGQQKASSELRVAIATHEDQQKRQNQRILRLERLLEERLPVAEDTTLAINDLNARVSEVEAGRSHDFQLAVMNHQVQSDAVSQHHQRSEPVESAVDSAHLAQLEKRLTDACTKLEAFHQESHDLHIKVEAQEERLKSLRTRIETQEDHHRTLGDTVQRMDAQREIKEVKEQIAEMSKERIEHSENLQLLQKNHETVAQESSEMRELLRRLQLPQHSEASEVREPGSEAGPASEALVEEVQDCLRQLSEAKGRLDELSHEVNTAKADMELGPRVAALVDQLKQVAPKVMDQELSVRELHERLGRIEVQSRLGEERTASEGTLGRIGKLESEVDRIKEKVKIEALGAQGEVSAAGVSG